MVWSTDAAIQAKCVDLVKSVTNEPHAPTRTRRALLLIADAMNLGLADERCASYCSVVAMSALYPDEYRTRD
jgi:hypothetical protein